MSLKKTLRKWYYHKKIKSIGENTYIAEGVKIFDGKNIEIGKNVWISPNSTFGAKGGLKIGNY